MYSFFFFSFSKMYTMFLDVTRFIELHHLTKLGYKLKLTQYKDVLNTNNKLKSIY